MKNQRGVSRQQRQENQQPPPGGATTTVGAAVLLSRSSSSSACGCIEPIGIILAVISLVVHTVFRFLFWYRPWWLATVIPFLLTLGAVVCLFRAAKRYQNEQQQRSLSSSSAGVVCMVLSWVFCAVAGVMAIVDVVFYDSIYSYYYQYELRLWSVTLVGMFIAPICMLIYAEISRRKATGPLTQRTNVVVGDIEAPVNTNDEPSIGPTPPTAIAQEVRGSVLAQEVTAEEQNNNNHNAVVEVLPTGSYYVPNNKDQCRSVVAPAPRALVIGDPILDGSSIVEQQGQGQGQRQRRAAIDP
jgi:hypothetical protein